MKQNILFLSLVILIPFGSVMGVDLPSSLRLGNQTISLEEARARSRVNRQVQFLLRYPKGTAQCLNNTKKLFPIAKSKLKEQDLPVFLAYLIAPESCGRLDAVSRKRAQGPWQGNPSTARRLGYSIGDLRSPVRSSEFAAKYLRELHDQFPDDWLLVIAAYNTGENNVKRAIDYHQSRDFWMLSSLYSETKNFVPTMLAYIIIDQQNLVGDLQSSTLAYTQNFELPSDTKIGSDYSIVKVKVVSAVSPIIFVEWGGISIAELLAANPHFNFYGFNLVSMPAGKIIKVVVPKQLREKFIINMGSLKDVKIVP